MIGGMLPEIEAAELSEAAWIMHMIYVPKYSKSESDSNCHVARFVWWPYDLNVGDIRQTLQYDTA